MTNPRPWFHKLENGNEKDSSTNNVTISVNNNTSFSHVANQKGKAMD